MQIGASIRCQTGTPQRNAGRRTLMEVHDPRCRRRFFAAVCSVIARSQFSSRPPSALVPAPNELGRLSLVPRSARRQALDALE